MSISITKLTYRHFTGLDYNKPLPTTCGTLAEVPIPGRRRKRAIRRTVFTAVNGAFLYGLAVDFSDTILATQLGAGCATVYGGYRTAEWALSWRHRRRVVVPLAKALSRPLENDPDNILKRLVVPTRHTGPDAVVKVPVPDGWHGDRQMVKSVVTARLGGDWVAEWRMHEAPFTAVFTRAPEPPQMVKWAEIQGHIKASKPGEVVVGLDNHGRPVRGDFVREEPMWGLSIGSGGGKSVFLWCTVAQLVAQGARIVAIDPKFISLDPLMGVPGIEVYSDPRNVQQMWDAIHDFRLEMESRFDAWTKDRSLEFERLVLVLEEGNMFSDLSKDYWREVKTKKDPSQPPVWGDIAAILRMGRQANCNMIAVFQRMDDQATGGRGLRDSFGFRVLGRYTWQAWKMLVGTMPIPRSQKRRGRFIVVDGGEHTWIQAPYATAEEIREFCLEARAEQGMTSRHADDEPVDQERSAERDVTSLTLVKTEGRYNLASAAREGIVPLSAEALRQAKRRPGFPEAGPDGKWSAADLQGWLESRRTG